MSERKITAAMQREFARIEDDMQRLKQESMWQCQWENEDRHAHDECTRVPSVVVHFTDNVYSDATSALSTHGQVLAEDHTLVSAEVVWDRSDHLVDASGTRSLLPRTRS